jgi:CubicO group peptidase (beta-lactamase class C family)
MARGLQEADRLNILKALIVASTAYAASAFGNTAALPPHAATATPSLSAEPSLLADPARLEAFVDGMVGAQMAELQSPGAAVVIVHRDRVLLARGYGFADRERALPVSPSRTLFRVASISKLFAATAVLQQVATGKLDLDRDVNAYLDFAVPSTFDAPITLRHLLSHTAGFEDRDIGLFTFNPANAKAPLGETLARNMPGRRWPPGKIASYSNYGVSLAGYIAARAAVRDYEALLQQAVFGPLGMTSTTTLQPVPKGLAGRLATGYVSDGGIEPGPFEYVLTAPASTVSATADDMARFMRAQLNHGLLDGVQALPATVVDRMHQPLFNSPVGANAIGPVFIHQTFSGLSAISHGGDLLSFAAMMVLVPEKDFGVLILFNTANVRAAYQFPEVLIAAAFGAPAAPVSYPVSEADLKRYIGVFSGNRHSVSSIEKLHLLFDQRDISTSGDGQLVMRSSGRLVRWRPIGPDAFVEVTPGGSGNEQLLFERTGAAEAPGFAYLNGPEVPFGRVAWYETQVFARAVTAAVAIATMLLIGHALAARRPLAAHARQTAGLLAVSGAMNLLFAGLVVRQIRPMLESGEAIDLPPGLPLILAIPLFAVIFSLVALVPLVRHRAQLWPVGQRALSAFALLCFGAFWAGLAVWNLFGFHY